MAEIIKLFLSATKMTVSFIKNKICTYVRDEKRTRKKSYSIDAKQSTVVIHEHRKKKRE